MICGYVVAVGEWLLADVAVCGCGFEVCPYFSVSCIVVEGAPPFALSFSFIYWSLMCCTVTATCCELFAY